MRPRAGRDTDKHLPKWTAMLAPLPLGPVRGEVSEFSAPQPLRGFNVDRANSDKKRYHLVAMAGLAPAIVFWRHTKSGAYCG